MRPLSIAAGSLALLLAASANIACAQSDGPLPIFHELVRPGGVIDTLSMQMAGSSQESPQNISRRPSIDCLKVATRGGSAVARILCDVREGAAADWDLNAVLWAMAGTKSDAEQRAFDLDQQQWRDWLNKKCGLTSIGRVTSQDQQKCVIREFHSRAEALRAMLSGDILAETRLNPEQHVEIQEGLIARGLLQAKADGEFGVVTRQAIRRFQEADGSGPTGFLSEGQRRALLTKQSVASPATEPKPDHSMNWGATFKAQVEKCWKKPQPISEPHIEAAFAIKLNLDGSLSESPVSETTPNSALSKAYQRSALEAIIYCQPYKLPPEYYSEWKEFAPVFAEAPASAQSPTSEQRVSETPSVQNRNDEPVTDCDTEAANPQDPGRKATGKSKESIDPVIAIIACQSATKTFPSSARFQYQLGRSFEAAKNFDQALAWYRKAATQNYLAAQYNLGHLYDAGLGVNKDEKEAFGWYRAAAIQGAALAQMIVGQRLAKGIGVVKDDVEAFAWLKKASDQGLAAAQVSLGYMYENGLGTTKDVAQAVHWYSRATEQGSAAAQNKLASMYQNGIGVTKDDAQAEFWYRKAAEQGDAEAKQSLATMERLAMQDKNDVVAQVLNYSNFGNDDGLPGYGSVPPSFWTRNGKCRYTYEIPIVRKVKVLDLDGLTPSAIAFRTNEEGQVSVWHANEVLISSTSPVALERVERGWALIYSKYCTGKRKEF